MNFAPTHGESKVGRQTNKVGTIKKFNGLTKRMILSKQRG